LSASILIGSLVGPLIAGFIGLAAALLVAGVLRMVAGYAISKVRMAGGESRQSP